MRRELVFAVVPALPDEILTEVVKDFEAQHNAHVEIKRVEWDNYRSDIVNMALRQLPVDVALVGSPVTSDLLGMNVLRPFSSAEIKTFGGAASFLPSRWEASMRPGDPLIWSIPYVVDIRVLYYWRDVLQKANIDEKIAFRDAENIKETFQTLRDNGFEFPWEVYDLYFEVLHSASSWIWEKGGNLFDPTGSQVIFNQPEAIAGLEAYFDLLRFVPPERTGSPIELFQLKKVVAGISNAWGFIQELPDDVGCAPLPGGSYIGGSDLVIWRSTHHESTALQFVRYLLQPEIQSRLVFQTGNTIPGRTELLVNAVHGDPVRQAILEAAMTGKMYPCVPMIGLVEERLSFELAGIQKELLENPHSDIRAKIQPRLDLLARRINAGLSSIPRRT